MADGAVEGIPEGDLGWRAVVRRWGSILGTGLAGGASWFLEVVGWVGTSARFGMLWWVVGGVFVGARASGWVGCLCLCGSGLVVVCGFGSALGDFVWFEGVVGCHFHAG